jgi:hypothetical protein
MNIHILKKRYRNLSRMKKRIKLRKKSHKNNNYTLRCINNMQSMINRKINILREKNKK